MSTFRMGRGEVWWQVPMEEGWVYYGWAVENNPWLALAGMKRIGKGYVGQQIESLVIEAKEYFNSP